MSQTKPYSAFPFNCGTSSCRTGSPHQSPRSRPQRSSPRACRKYFQRESCRGCKQIEGMSMNMDELSKSTIWGNNKQLSNKESRLRACLSCQHGSWNSPRCSCCRQNLAEDFYSRDRTGFQQQPTSKRAACPHRHLLDVVSIGQFQIVFVNKSIFLKCHLYQEYTGSHHLNIFSPSGMSSLQPWQTR